MNWRNTLSILLVLFIFATGIAFGQQTTEDFESQRIISDQLDGAIDVHAGDLDGDNDADVVAVGRYGNKVVWYENLGGSFSSEKVIGSGFDNADCVYVVDIDSDGDQDVLLASHGDDKIALFRNTSSGFADAELITSNADGANYVYADDIDGDGDVDVLSASQFDGHLAWYENTGSGFSSANVIATMSDGPETVQTADLNNDGRQDVLVSSGHTDEILWYENTSEGFSSGNVISDSADGARDALPMDVDGDGRVDVVSVSKNINTIRWYENTSSGFSGNIVTDSADEAFDVHPADLDLDGDLDLVSASHDDDKVAWYENTGNGFGTQNIINQADFDNDPDDSNNGNTDKPRSVFTADINGDGKPDVLSASIGDDKIAFYRNIIGSKTYDGWSKLAGNNEGPPNRDFFRSTYDREGNNIFVLTKNRDERGYIWKFDLSNDQWSKLDISNFPSGEYSQIQYNPSDDHLYVWWNGLGQVYKVPKSGGSLSAVGSQSNSSDYFGHNTIWDPVNNSLLTYGGYGWYEMKNEIHRFSSSSNSWNQVSITGSEPYPAGGKIAIDENAGIMYKMSGWGNQSGQQDDGFYEVDDLWKFDLANNTWEELISVGNVNPINRMGQGFAINVDDNQLLAFGGAYVPDTGNSNLDTRQHFDDLYQYNIGESSNFSRVSIEGVKPAPRRTSMYYDRANKRLILIGGDNQNRGRVYSDVWALPLSDDSDAPTVNVSLKDTIGTVGDTLSVPIEISAVNSDILSFEFSLGFDSSKVKFVGYKKENTLSNGFSISSNLSGGDVLNLSGASSTPFSSDGTLLKLQFALSSTGESPLGWQSFLFNEGSPSANTADGNISVKNVTYGDVTGNGSVSAFDAAKVLQYTVGKISDFSFQQSTAADVSGNGSISALDAAYILKKTVDESFQFPVLQNQTKSKKSVDALLAWNSATEIGSNKWEVPVVVKGDLEQVRSAELSVNVDPSIDVEEIETDLSNGWIKKKNMDGNSINISVAGTQKLKDRQIFALKVNSNSNPLKKLKGKGFVNENDPSMLKEAGDQKPSDFTLGSAYPNPFNPTATISYSLPTSEHVSIVVYNSIGKEVAQLVSERKDAGTYRVKFHGENLSSGIYIYRLQAGAFTETKKMMLVK